MNNQDVLVRMIDSFMFFTTRGMELINSFGSIGFVLPDVFFYQGDCEKLRAKLLARMNLLALATLGEAFEGVTRSSAVMVAHNRLQPDDSVNTLVIDVANRSIEEKFKELNRGTWVQTSSDLFRELPGNIFVTRNFESYSLFLSLRRSASNTILENFLDGDGIQRGISPDYRAAFVVSNSTIEDMQLEKAIINHVITGGFSIKPFRINELDEFIIYIDDNVNITDFPNIKAHIDSFAEQITCTEVAEGKHSIYRLHRPRSRGIFSKPEKIMGVITEDEIIVAVDRHARMATDGVYLFGLREGVDPNVCVGILNSEYFNMLYKLLAIEEGKAMAQVKPSILVKVPIPKMESFTSDELNRIVDLTSSLTIESSVEATDELNQIVRNVYERSIENVRHIND